MRFGNILSGWLSRFWSETPLGQRGESAAARFLIRKGYKIVAQGDQSPVGEIDLVAVTGRTVVFVEVKTRESSDYGNPSEAVNATKQRRLTRLAVTFLKRHGLLEYPARFDVIAIIWPADRKHPTIEHTESAFDAIGQDEFYS